MNTDEDYWKSYNGLQHAKHQLLREYLARWFPILASWPGRLLYIDCHAGRGRHISGHEGSPILALRLLMDHAHRAQILTSTEANFVFFESNPDNFHLLDEEVRSLGKLPKNINVHLLNDNYENSVRQLLSQMRLVGRRWAPSFAFVDPYTFTLSMGLLNDLLAIPNCELLINFMYRYIDMAMRHESQTQNMDNLFGHTGWRELLKISDAQTRSNETIKLFTNQLNARYVTTMRMHGLNGALKYVLIHATNHRKGREVMKDAIWKVTPDGSFSASERTSPNQMVLIHPEPDLSQLNSTLWHEFEGKNVEMNDLYEWLLDQVFLPKHLHKVLRLARREGRITASGYTGPFAFNKNPVIKFISQAP